MSKKESVNSFNEGLIMDLNPVNTPNNVLTDCLNGTIITYDKNEFNLQNDRGNFPLPNCKLKDGYIPIGLKEYGDILYIVSYNPLDEHVEIGSYPSPQTIFKPQTSEEITDDGANSSDILSIKNRLTKSGELDYEKDIKPNEKETIFYGIQNSLGTSSEVVDSDEFMLNPGDKYKLNISNYTKYEYETLDFFILDKNKKSYSISGKIKNNSFIENKDTINFRNIDFKNINWNIPGWLMIKPRFAEIKDFKINVRKAFVSSYTNKFTLNLNFQIFIEDELIKKNPNGLRIKIIEHIAGASDEIFLESSKLKSVNLNNGIYIFYGNLNKVLDVEAIDSIKIEAVPEIKTSNIIVNYNNLKQQINFNTKSTASVSDIYIGENTWWYSQDSENNKLILRFDTEGIPENSIMNEELYLYYSIKGIPSKGSKVGNFILKDDNTKYENILLDEWNLTRDTTIELNLTQKSTNPDLLYPENLYIIDFGIYKSQLTEENKTTNLPIRTFKKLIICSELMNNRTEQRLDLIPFEDWIGNYKDTIKNKNFVINNFENTIINTEKDKDPSFTKGYEAWKKGCPSLICNINEVVPKKYDTFSSELDLSNDLIEEGFNVIATQEYSTKISYSSPIKLLTGPLWDSLISSSYLSSKLNSTHKTVFDNKTGECIVSVDDPLIETIQSFIKREKEYKFKNLLGYENKVSIWNYNIYPINIYPSLKMEFFGDAAHKDNQLTINFKPPIINSKTVYANNYNFNIVPVQKLLSMISNKKDSGKYDVLGVDINVGSRSSNQYEYACLSTLGRGDSSAILKAKDGTNNGGTEYSGTVSYIVLKSKNILYFIDSSHKSEVEAFRHLICDNNSTKLGTFYKAIEKNIVETNTSNFKIGGEVVVGDLIYKNWNLFDNEQRNTLNSTISDISLYKNLEVSDSFKNAKIKIDPIKIEEKEETINLGNLSSEIEDTLNSILNKGNEIIMTLNDKVEKQCIEYQNDKIFKGLYKDDSNIYDDLKNFSSTADQNTTINNDIKNLLNETTSLESEGDTLYADSYSNHKGDGEYITVYIGYLIDLK